MSEDIQAAFKEKLKRLSPADLELWMHDTVVYGTGAISEDKAGNVSYVPFLTALRAAKEAKTDG